MLDYRVLYQNKTALQWPVQAYSVFMCHIARVTDGSNLATVKGDIGLATLARRTIALPQCSQYLLGTDAFGVQAFICLTGDVRDAWAQCMTLGLNNEAGINGKTFSILWTWADAIYADLVTQFTGDTPVFLAGHGLGGAVAALVALKLKKASKKIQQVYLTAACEFADVNLLPEFNGVGDGVVPVPCWWMGLPEDELSWAPPASLSSANWWGAGSQPLAELFVPGLGANWDRTGRNRVSINDIVDVNDPLGWPARIPDSMRSNNSSDYYVNMVRRWIVTNDLNNQRLGALVSTLNANFGLGLPLLTR